MGHTSPRIREKLWDRATQKLRGGSVIQVWTDRNPQGFSARSAGGPSREFVDFEGLVLLRRAPRKARRATE